MKIQFSQKITGERKHIMEQLSHTTGVESKYMGAPSFAFESGGWMISRNSVLSTPAFGVNDAAAYSKIMASLVDVGFSAEGQLQVTLFPDALDETVRQNMEALLCGKESLIRQSLGTEEALTVTASEDSLSLAFFPASLEQSNILAAIQFSLCIHTQAGSQKQVRTKDKPVDNPKYAMRCFLLRIGMIGEQYAKARKALLQNLTGNSSFKSGSRSKSSTDGSAISADPPEDCLACAGSMSELGEDENADRLFCTTRQEYVSEDGGCSEFNA